MANSETNKRNQMKIEQLHQLFLECQSVCTDTRKIKTDEMFFALKGDNFNGNTYAEQAIQNDMADRILAALAENNLVNQ